MSESNVVFCKDCEHYEIRTDGLRPHWYCCNRITKPTGLDLLTGEPIMDVRDAREERKKTQDILGEGGPCGEAGRYFEPKKIIQDYLININDVPKKEGTPTEVVDGKLYLKVWVFEDKYLIPLYDYDVKQVEA